MYQIRLAYNRYHNGIVLLYETELEAAGVAGNLAKHGKPNEEGDQLLVIVSKVAEEATEDEPETPDD